MLRSLLMAVFALLAACSPSLSTLQPARTVPSGHFQVTAAVSGTPAVGVAGDALDLVERFDSLPSRPSQAEVQELAEDSLAAVVAPPSIDARLALAYGVSQRFELDVQVGATGVAAGFRVQLLRERPGIYVALGAMVGLQYADFPIERFTSSLEIASLGRQDFSFPLTIGYSGKYLHFWAGPKLVLTHFDAELELCLHTRAGVCDRHASIQGSGLATHLAGQLGIAVGKGQFWIAAELTVAHVWVNGDFDLEMPSVQTGLEFSRSGTVVTPALGFIAWF